MGYTNVAVDPMGNDEWERRGYKTWTIEDITAAEEPEAVRDEEPAKPAAPSDIKQGAFPGSIDDNFFIELARNNPESVQLIDVREPDEFEKGHIATARRMNVAEIRAAMDGFDTSERPIVLYCATGARSRTWKSTTWTPACPSPLTADLNSNKTYLLKPHTPRAPGTEKVI